MLSKILFRWLPSSIVLLGLTGCAEFDQRKGPDPLIDATSVQAASNNKYWILNALATDANVHDGDPDYYYLVTEAGFNYVDDQCRGYFNSLFFLNRRRDELKSGLATAGATTAAILGVTQASVPSLAIVAAAFGLASNATDIVAGTYLYGRSPAAVQGFVERLQLAYRAEAANKRALINSPTGAYYQIQRYLSLCLPPTIEAEIDRQISSAGAVAVPAGPGEFFAVQSVGAPASALPKVGVSQVSFPKTGPASSSMGRGTTVKPAHSTLKGNTPIGPTVAVDVGLPRARTPSEMQMSADELGRFQRNVLCVPETPQFDSRTRDGITIFQQTRLMVATGQIDVPERKELIFQNRNNHDKPCPAGAQNFFELRSYFSGGKLLTERVNELQQLLNAKSEGGLIGEIDLSDPATRKKIAAVRQGMPNLRDVPSATDQVTPPFFRELKR